MIEKSLARTPRTRNSTADADLEHVGTVVPRALLLSARMQRGIVLAEERFDEIVRVRPWNWSVPSCSGDHAHEVDLKHGICPCPDRPPENERCKHHSAAAYKKAKTATCSGCAGRFRHRDLVEVQESLTYFEGDLLCPDCRHGSDADVL